MGPAALSAPTMDEYLEDSWRQIFTDCTLCGKCVEVCPVRPTSPLISGAPAPSVVGGVLDFMRSADGGLPAASRDWTSQCNGCGDCIPACPEGVNPRRMLMLANAKLSKETQPTPHTFRKMVRAIRLFVAMQLLPEDAQRLLRPPGTRKADLIFYSGCNPVRTPNLLFNVMSMLDALGVDYEFMGGPAACCGVIHSKWEGDQTRGAKVSEMTLRHFGNFTPQKVIGWCPTCQIHLGETISGYRQVEFEMGHITRYLLDNIDKLGALMKTPVDMRVVLHTHQGMGEAGDSVLALLQRVPGLKIVRTICETGYMCGASGSDKSPKLKAIGRAVTLQAMQSGQADALVSLHHGCHRQLLTEGRNHGFRVVNFTEILVRALGQNPWPDTIEPLQGRTDWANLVKETMPMLQANGIKIDPEELLAVMPELWGGAEWKGGLCSFAPN